MTETKNKEFVIKLKNIEDDSDEVVNQINDVDCIIVDCDVDVYVENNGIGAYEFWGFRGVDKGVDYLILENSDEFDLKFVFEEGIPEGTPIKDLEEFLIEFFSMKREYTYGADERSDGLSMDLKLVFNKSKIEGNTFSCTASWEDEEA